MNKVTQEIELLLSSLLPNVLKYQMKRKYKAAVEIKNMMLRRVSLQILLLLLLIRFIHLS